MENKYEITKRSIIFNFSESYVKNETEVLSSEAFKCVFTNYLNHLKDIENSNLLELVNSVEEPTDTFILLFKLLISFDIDEVSKINLKFEKILNQKETFYEFVEDLYDYWRHLERYAVVKTPAKKKSIEEINFVSESENFNQLILRTYRAVAQKALGTDFHIYRQLSAGINASFSICKNNWAGKDSKYQFLNDLAFINYVVIRPPFIFYTDKNTRTGIFPEDKVNPILGLSISNSDWYCYPAKIGGSLAYVYFHKDYIDHGVALCNLFEFVHMKDCLGKKPDLIFMFGAPDKGKPRFFYDKEEDIYTALVPHNQEYDYFGYMKKMLLTIHNVKMIKENYLPIHGAGVLIKLKSGVEKMLVLMGDSGAGKSESLEALKTYAGNDIVSTKTIFDDMGTFIIKDNQVYAIGTEIGAFVRLDDLENGYAYQEMDRAIFMNPNMTNSRLVMPVATYPQIMKGYPVDMFFYANNYSKDKEIMSKFKNKEDAIKCFKEGARVAKGTTSEKGLVTSYFANPFGPVQMQEECNVLLDKYFDCLFNNNIFVGEIHTRLAIPGQEHEGPKQVAKFLFNLVKNKKEEDNYICFGSEK